MEHDVRAKLERVLQVRGRKRVVDDDDRADLVRRVRGRADVDDVQEWIGRRFDPHELRALVEMLSEVRELLDGKVIEHIALRLVDL
jgi:hypothetical protein